MFINTLCAVLFKLIYPILGRELINANGYLIFTTTCRRFQIVTDVLAV